MSTEVKEIYEDSVEAGKLKNPADFVDKWKKMESHFQAGSAGREVSAEDELLQWPSDVLFF